VNKTRAVRIAIGIIVGGLGAFIAAMASRGGTAWAITGGGMIALALLLVAWPSRRRES